MDIRHKSWCRILDMISMILEKYWIIHAGLWKNIEHLGILVYSNINVPTKDSRICSTKYCHFYASKSGVDVLGSIWGFQ